MSRKACTDGQIPVGLVQATNGNLHGVAAAGGAHGAGTVFKINSGGTFTTLYSFCWQDDCTDGGFPRAGLAQGTDGNFYGTTEGGGARGGGTLFRISPSGTLTTLHSFDSTDGITPPRR